MAGSHGIFGDLVVNEDASVLGTFISQGDATFVSDILLGDTGTFV